MICSQCPSSNAWPRVALNGKDDLGWNMMRLSEFIGSGQSQTSAHKGRPTKGRPGMQFSTEDLSGQRTNVGRP